MRSGLAHETDIGVLQAVIRQAVSALYLFTPHSSSAKPALAAFAERPSVQSAAAARSGSDHQLALFRCFVEHCAHRQPARLPSPRRSLDGARASTGLTLDADLRWTLGAATGRNRTRSAPTASRLSSTATAPPAVSVRRRGRVLLFRPSKPRIAAWRGRRRVR